jgi:hypothetical protein
MSAAPAWTSAYLYLHTRSELWFVVPAYFWNMPCKTLPECMYSYCPTLHNAPSGSLTDNEHEQYPLWSAIDTSEEKRY